MAYSGVEIRLGGLSVSVHTELNYPDGLDDLVARSLLIFKEGVEIAVKNEIDITTMSLHTTDFEDEDD
jgi:hypothetical protein